MTAARLVDRIDHIVLAVRDVEKSGPAMARMLGCTPSWKGLQPAEGTVNMLFRLANTTIELLGAEGNGPVGNEIEAQIEAHGEGLFRIDFGTHDLDAVRESLRSHGIDTGEARDGLSHDDPSGAWRRFQVLDIPSECNRGVRTRVVEDTSPDDIVPMAQPIHDDGSCVARLDHVVVMTPAPEHALAFYGDALGMRLALDRTFEKRGVRLIFFRAGGLTLEIGSSLQGDVEADIGGDVEDDSGDSLWGLAHQVEDADLARARIIEAGHAATDVRTGNKPGTRVFTVNDAPVGVPTLFIEPVKQDAEG